MHDNAVTPFRSTAGLSRISMPDNFRPLAPDCGLLSQFHVVSSQPLGRGQLADFRSGGRRTHSLRIDLDMLVVAASPARTGLKISQLIRRPPGGIPPTYDAIH